MSLKGQGNLREQLEEKSDIELKEKYETLTKEAKSLSGVVEDTILDVAIECLDILYIRNSDILKGSLLFKEQLGNN